METNHKTPWRGKMASRVLVPCCLATVAWGAQACNANNPVYFPGPIVLEVDGSGMTAAIATVPLRFREEVESEQTQRRALSDQLGYEVPRLREDRIHVEVRYTITNLSAEEGIFSLFVDGATEFTRFDYAAVAGAFDAANADPPPVGLIPVPNAPILAPGQVYQGVVREDDFHEGSLDLDAMGRWMGNFVAVLINRSEVNPIGLEMAPANLIRPALWEITPRFNANRPMRCEFLVRVRDDNQRLWEDGDDEFTPAPDTFMPVIMP